MPKVIVPELLPLGGVMEEPASWQQGHSTPEIGQFKQSELFGSGALLLGRVPYEGFVQYWPDAVGTGEFGERMNSLPKFVATTTLGSLEWNAAVLEGDAATAVERLKRREGGSLLVYGSGTSARALLRRRLVDELRLLVYPSLSGADNAFSRARTDCG